MNIHELKIDKKFFASIEDGSKSFEIRKNDRNYAVNDILLLKEYDRELDVYTGNKLLQQVTYITDYEQQENHIVMSLKYVPTIFYTYMKMSAKEKDIFEKILSHKKLYTFGSRDTANTMWDILRTLLKDDEEAIREESLLSNTDEEWFAKYFYELENQQEQEL